MLVDEVASQLGVANDGQAPMLVLADRHEDVLYLTVEQVDVPRPPLHLVELNVVPPAILLSIHQRKVTRQVLRDHLHEIRVEKVDLRDLFLCQHEVLQELQEEEDEGVVEVNRGLQALEVLDEDAH